MTLRRFPWKIPRMTDNSYKLFASDPTPGHDPNKMLGISKSANDLTDTRTRDFLNKETKQFKETEKEEIKEKQGDQNGHNDHHKEKKDEHKKEEAKKDGQPPAKEIIRGPWRILRLLPRESRHIVHRMLDLNPKTRAKMDEIIDTPWVADSVICQQLEDGEVLAAENHTHILEPPNTPAQ